MWLCLQKPALFFPRIRLLFAERVTNRVKNLLIEVTPRAKPYQLALLINKSLDNCIVASRVPIKPLCYTSIKIFSSPLSMLYLQNVLLIHLKK